MRQKIYAAMMCGVLGLTPALGAAADVKIGYVNPGKVMEEAPQAQQARQKLKEEFDPRQRKLAAEQNELAEMEKKLERDSAVMSESERREREREILSRRRELRRDQEALREDFNIRRNEEMNQLQRRVQKAVVRLAEDRGFDLIVTDSVLYASDRIDITAQVIDALESRYDASSASGQ